MSRFTIEPHNHADKRFAISNDDITLLVDYDDVDHDSVDIAANKLIRILNEHWDG